MHHRLLLPLALIALGAAACGGGTPEPATPPASIVAPPSAPVAVRSEPTPLAEPSAPEGSLQAKRGVGPKTDAEPTDGVAAAIAQVEAEANYAQQHKDKAKWEKLGRDVERKAADADARDRLQRATARVAQAQGQLSRVPPARRGRFNTDIAAFGTKKADVQARISGISSYGSDEWRHMRAELDHALDELDAAATRVETDLF